MGKPYRTLLTALAIGATLTSCKLPAPTASTDATSPPGPTTTHPPLGRAAPLGTESTGAVNGPGPAGSCTLRHDGPAPLPDPACTPGATNAAVTPDTLDDTICKPGWATKVRPSSSVTTPLKRKIAAAYSIPPDGELDHLVSIELGGALVDAHNLWVEPGPIPNAKDPLENQLNDAICARLVPLAAVQTAIAQHWTTALADLGLAANGSHVCLISEPTRCA